MVSEFTGLNLFLLKLESHSESDPLGWHSPQYQYRLGDESIESILVEEALGILRDGKRHEVAMYSCSPES